MPYPPTDAAIEGAQETYDEAYSAGHDSALSDVKAEIERRIARYQAEGNGEVVHELEDLLERIIRPKATGKSSMSLKIC